MICVQQDKINRSWSQHSKFYKCETDILIRSTLLYIEELGYFETFAPYSTERHFKDAYLLVATLKGKGCLFYEGVKYDLKHGDVFIIDCRKYHKYWSLPEEDWSFMWLHFNGMPMMTYERLFLQKKTVYTINMSLVQNLIQEMLALQEQDGKLVEKALKNNLLLNEVLSNLFSHYITRTGSEMKVIPSYLEQAIELYNKKYKENITLNDLEQTLNVSKFTILKSFKKFLHVTPHEYLIELRLREAQKLLLQTNLTINEIANAVGMSHVGHFINLFKRRMEGLTPAKFREQCYLEVMENNQER